jgi:hypothetical protein
MIGVKGFQKIAGIIMAGLAWGSLSGQGLAATVTILPEQVLYVLGTETTGEVIRSDAPSEVGLTVPSLWWAVRQFGSHIVRDWSAYPAAKRVGGRVEVYVSAQAWGQLDYLNRYSFSQRLGTSASDSGYNLLIVDRLRTILAAYTCDFQAWDTPFIPGMRDFQGQPVPDFVSGAKPTPLQCQVWINPVIPVSIF